MARIKLCNSYGIQASLNNPGMSQAWEVYPGIQNKSLISVIILTTRSVVSACCNIQMAGAQYALDGA